MKFYFCCSHCGEKYIGTDKNHNAGEIYHVHFACKKCGKETELHIDPKTKAISRKEMN